MTQQTRTTALQEAVKAAALTGGDSDILSLAEQFNSFLVSDDVPAAASAAPAAPAPTPAKAKATKPAKPAKVSEPTPEPESPADEEEADETEAAGPSADDVKGVISNLIGAGQRDELVNLLKKFKATSFSGIKATDYAKFVAEGNQIAENAKLAQ